MLKLQIMISFAISALFFLSIVIAIIYLSYREKQQSHQNWLSWPTMQEYWKKYPNCRTDHGTKCHFCHSRNIRHVGWNESYDYRRIHKCQQCHTRLYRSRS